MALKMLALFVILSLSLYSGEIAGRVIRVADGDTITILVSGGNPDTPEPVRIVQMIFKGEKRWNGL